MPAGDGAALDDYSEADAGRPQGALVADLCSATCVLCVCHAQSKAEEHRENRPKRPLNSCIQYSAKAHDGDSNLSEDTKGRGDVIAWNGKTYRREKPTSHLD